MEKKPVTPGYQDLVFHTDSESRNFNTTYKLKIICRNNVCFSKDISNVNLKNNK